MTVTDMGQEDTALTEFKNQSRGGYGKLNYRVNEEKGHVIGIKVVNEDDDIIMISNDGVIIRIRVSDVNVMSRYASGVRVMRVKDDAKVVTFARSEHEEDAETQKVESGGEDITAEEAAALEAAEAAEEQTEKEADEN